MSKTLRFKWVPPININEGYRSLYPDSFLDVKDVWTARSLDQLVEAAKSVEDFTDVKVPFKDTHTLCVNGLNTPLQLITLLTIHGNRNQYEISDEGPSLNWLLTHSKEIGNPNPSKVFYVGCMVVQFSSDPYNVNTVTVAVFNTKHVDTYVRTLEDDYIEGLDEPLEEFLASYGYIDESMYASIAKVVITFQGAKKLGFLNAEEVVTHFNDKHLVADLKLKGVLADIEEYCL